MNHVRGSVRSLAGSVGPIGPIAIAVLLYWAWKDGGFSSDEWGFVGSGLVLLLAVAILADMPATLGGAERTTRIVLLGALGGFVVWNFASIRWADFNNDAWIGSNKTLLYAVLFSIFFLWRWEVRAATVALVVYTIGTAGIGVVLLVQAVADPTPESLFQDGRLLPPIGYVNANVALWMLAFWPAVIMGASRTVPIAVRAILLGSATVLLGLCALGESRGWFYLLPIVVATTFLLARQRLRTLAGMAIPAAAIVVVLDPILDVYSASADDQPLGPPVDRAVMSIGIAALVATGLGACWGLVDRRIVLSRRAHVGCAAVVGAVAVLVVAAGVVLAAQTIAPEPGRWAEERWSDFTRGYPVHAEGPRFTGSLGTDRYLQWKVAIQEFADHPIVGIGSDNYLAAYLLERTSEYIDPRYPHSTPLRLLSQLGLVGTALFVTFAGCAVWLALRRRRHLDADKAAPVVAALCMLVYWLLHGSLDFFWEIPALAGPVFAFLGLGASVALPESPRGTPGPTEATVPEKPPGRIPSAAALGAVVALCAAAAVTTLLLPWLSFRYQNAGIAAWRNELDTAYEHFDRAAALNPAATDPVMLAGTIALTRRDLPSARRRFEEAVRREPKNWYGHFQLAVTQALEDDYDRAIIEIDIAHALNPSDTILDEARATIKERGTPDPELYSGLYLRELNRRLTGNPRL